MTTSSAFSGLSAIQLVEHKVQDSINKYLDSQGVKCDLSSFQPIVTLGKAEHGDYQSNVALALSKVLKKKPSQIAASIIDTISTTVEVDPSCGVVGRVDMSGPGFINIHLSEEYLQSALAQMARDPHKLGIPPATNPQRVVVDFSSPNIAKEMHVVRASLHVCRLNAL
jgi:arginyl-tRNA synthetase